MKTCIVYVPIAGSRAERLIDHGSGVVGSLGGDTILVDFEGNRFGASNVVTYADRVAVAASRHAVSYPTIARASPPASDLCRIGVFDGVHGEVVLDGRPERDLLAAWLREASVTGDELVASGHAYEGHRMLRDAEAAGDQHQARIVRQAYRL